MKTLTLLAALFTMTACSPSTAHVDYGSRVHKGTGLLERKPKPKAVAKAPARPFHSAVTIAKMVEPTHPDTVITISHAGLPVNYHVPAGHNVEFITDPSGRIVKVQDIDMFSRDQVTKIIPMPTALPMAEGTRPMASP